MFFLNLSAGEFFIALGAAVALITALYMLGQSKQKKIVSTLRFWAAAGTAYRQHQRKRMREPWSFLLQVLSVLLLLLAVAQLEWGSRERTARKHVLLLDTSAWSSEQSKGGTLLSAEKAMAERYLNRLPPQDRVMAVSVDALTTPLTLFTSDRAELSNAIRSLRPSYSALNLQRALRYAQHVEALSGDVEGEIVYIGPGHIANSPDAKLPSPAVPKNLRVMRVDADNENCGIERVDLRRDDQRTGVWDAAVAVKNYGKQSHVLQLTTRLGRQTFPAHSVALPAGGESAVEYSFFDDGGGLLTVQLQPGDVLPLDDQVTLRVPAGGKTRLAVFTRRPQALKPLIEADRQLRAVYFTPEQYRPRPDADLVLLDEMAPPQTPDLPSVWIAPPRNGAPVPVKGTTANDWIKDWNLKTVLGAGLRERETRIKAADVFDASDRDIVVASVSKGPIVVARPQDGNRPKLAVLGFDPLQDTSRFQATVPLLFANLFRWLAPAGEQISEVQANPVGEMAVPLTGNEQVGTLQVRNDQGIDVPFSVHDKLLTFFTSQPSEVTIQSGDTMRELAPVLADVAGEVWELPSSVKMGLPRSAVFSGTARDLWKWLAAAGAFGLLVEWLLFGDKKRRRSRQSPLGRQSAASPERELVSR